MSDHFLDEEEEKSSPRDFNSLAVIQKPITKADIKEVAGNIINDVMNGESSCLEVFVKMKAIVSAAEEVIETIKVKARDEAEKLHKNERKILGAELEVSQGSVKYSFAHDDMWQQLTDDIEDLTNQRKEREKKMIHALSFTDSVDAGGEVVPKAKVIGGTAAYVKTKFT